MRRIVWSLVVIVPAMSGLVFGPVSAIAEGATA
jgi:hypothetical protein